MSDDLRVTTLQWSRQWWDAANHMTWNPAGGLSPNLPARTLHLVPNTAWVAYALLGEDSSSDRAGGVAAIEALLALQYDDPGKKFHGTFAQFLETPYPPDDAQMWTQYDPNWRQFVGTAFAVTLEDFGDDLPVELAARMEASIRLACDGEAAESRLSATYANPALMCAWLDAWLGRRTGDANLVQRGEDFARAVVAEHDGCGAFEEFNSPTYYGIDLYALRLWVMWAPTDYFAEQGRRLETALWRHVVSMYHAGLRNFCGPYTRSYHPDATRSIALFALWQWALFGWEHAPIPSLDDPVIDHCHDLLAGPLFARLAAAPEDVDLTAMTSFTGGRTVAHRLPRGRVVTASIEEDLMIGAEESDNDWGGWTQFMPVTVHWREDEGVGVLWLTEPRVVRATARDASVLLADVRHPLSFAVLAPGCELSEDGFRAGRLRCSLRGATASVSGKRVELTPASAEVELTFAVT